MVSPGQRRRLEMLRRKPKAHLLNSSPPLVIKGVEPNRLIKLPRLNKGGQSNGSVLIVRQGNRERVRKIVGKVKAKITKRVKKAAYQ